MTKLVPAINSSSEEEFIKNLSIAVKLSSRIHVDIISSDYANTEPTISLQKLATFISDYPETEFDLHIMISDYTDYIEMMPKLERHRQIFQYDGNPEAIKEIIVKETYLSTNEEFPNATSINIGLALNLGEPIADIIDLLPLVSHLLIMGVKAGKSSQKLDQQSLRLLKIIATNYKDIELGFDGGVTKANILDIKESGASIINATSAIYSQKDPSMAYSKLMAIIE